MTLETLKIEFQAETSAVEERLSALGARLDGFSGTLSATVNSARTAGSASALGFAQSVDSGAALARQSAANVVASANFSDAAALRRARSAGGALASGFAAGISAKSGSVYSAVRRMVNQATQLIRSQLGIHSPSRVAAGFGGSFGEGFARGIQGSVAQVTRAADGLAAAAAFGVNAALPRTVQDAAPMNIAEAVRAALGDTNITIPLNVDGMKLGEASIRGINAVTRSAGRVLLNI